MCSIGGFYKFGTELTNPVESLSRLIQHSKGRGRDTFGLVSDLEGEASFSRVTISEFRSASRALPDGIVLGSHRCGIFTCRAEPTTEYVKDRVQDSIPPFISGDWVVAHNGTIANDAELLNRLRELQPDFVPPSTIDTCILAAYINATVSGSVFQQDYRIATILRDEVKGSFALAIYHRKTQRLYLACNYKPLALGVKDNLLWFGSFSEWLPTHSNDINYSWICNGVSKQLEPYSMIVIPPNPTEIYSVPLWRASATPNHGKTLVVCSGGLDSSVAAVQLSRTRSVSLLHFEYSCKAQVREVNAVLDLGKQLGCQVHTIKIDTFRNYIVGSVLTDDSKSIVTDRGGAASAEFAHEYVACRNLIFLSMAVGYAEVHGYDFVASGINLEESGAYGDNEESFIRKLNCVLPNATNFQRRIQLLSPVGNLMKHEIVALGLELEQSVTKFLGLTWSCYEGGGAPCGTCGCCYMRRKAFLMNESIDPVQYQVTPEEIKRHEEDVKASTSH